MSLKKFPIKNKTYWFKYEGKTHSGIVIGSGAPKEEFRDGQGNLIHTEYPYEVFFIKGIGLAHGFRAEELKESPEELL